MSTPPTRSALLLCVLLHLPCLCLSTGNLTVRLMHYYHSEDRLSDGRWCDQLLVGKSSSCDPLITVCLGQFRSTCDLLQRTAPAMKNTIFFDYWQTPKSAPTFVLLTQSLPSLIFIKVTVRDHDFISRKHDHIATFRETVSTRLGKTKLYLTPEDNDDIADMEVEMSASCDADYYGLRCDKYCQPRFNNEECTATGKRRCREGYYGPKCAFQRCFAANPCQNGGRCEQGPRGQICRCPLHYAGERCEIPDPCLSDPCLHNGVCSWVSNSSAFECRCGEHFRGERCQEFMPCQSSPCLHGGSCGPAPKGSKQLWHCACPPGFLPPRCTMPDLCASRPCLNNGRCSTRLRDGRPHFHCKCASEYSGSTCEIRPDPCREAICLNGGVCDIKNPPTCRCLPGTSGEYCETYTSLPMANVGKPAKVVTNSNGRKNLNTAVIAVLAGSGVCVVALVIAVMVIAKRRKLRGEKLPDEDNNKLFQESMRTEESSVRSVPLPKHVEEVERMKCEDNQSDENQIAFL